MIIHDRITLIFVGKSVQFLKWFFPVSSMFQRTVLDQWINVINNVLKREVNSQTRKGSVWRIWGSWIWWLGHSLERWLSWWWSFADTDVLLYQTRDFWIRNSWLCKRDQYIYHFFFKIISLTFLGYLLLCGTFSVLQEDLWI